MSGTTIAPAATGDTSVAFSTEAILSAQQATLHNVGAVGAAMLDGLTKVQTEIADFIAERRRSTLLLNEHRPHSAHPTDAQLVVDGRT